MKTILYTLFCFFCARTAVSQAPDWAWMREARGAGVETPRDMAVDASGNVYVVGTFQSAAMTAGSTTLSNPGSAGTGEVYLLKYDRTGAFQWARKATGAEEDVGMGVAIDGSGNVFITGWFQSPTLTFGNVTVNNFTTTAFEDIFLAKYDASGNVLWARAYGGAQSEFCYGVATDASGNCFITGEYYSLSVLFGNYGVINSGASDVFVTKISGSGTPLWSKRIGGGNIDYGRGVATDAAGSVYVTGFYNSATVPSFSPALSNAGGFDVFFAKYDAAGNNVLSGRVGASGDESAFAIATGAAGQFFVSGNYQSSTLQFGSTALTNGSGSDMFFAKFAASGSALWAKDCGSSQSVNWADLVTDAAGDLYAASSFNLSSITLGSISVTAGGSFGGFVAKFSGGNGNVLWARGTSSPGMEQLYAVAVGGGYAHVAGVYSGTLSMGALSSVADGGTDGFVAKLCTAPAGPLSASGQTVCAYSKGVLTASTPPGTRAVWFASASGGNALFTGQSFTPQVNGTYYVAAQDTNSGCAMISAGRLSATVVSHPRLNPAVSVNGNTLTATAGGSVVGWYDCEKTELIAGQTGSAFVVKATGSYAVIMKGPEGCADTSACGSYSYTEGTDTVVVVTGVDERAGETLLVFPNPAQEIVHVLSLRGGSFGLQDFSGKVLLEIDAVPGVRCEFAADGIAAGIYLLVPKDGTPGKRIVIGRGD